jgi:pumilio RNA-binding family
VLQFNAAENARFHAKVHSDLMVRLEAGGDESSSAVAAMRGSVRRLTFDAAGCRAVQKALEVADHQDAADLVAELHGWARRAITSPHGNYVIQKIIEAMPTLQSRFIIAELTGAVGEFSRHRYGCRIMCRLVEHSGTDPLTVGLTDEIVQEVGELCRHSYGHHVIEAVLEHGAMEQKHKIAAALHAKLFHNATDRYATYVIESALRHCSSADRNELVSAFLSDQERLLCLAEHPSGFHVVKGLLKYSGQRAAIASLLDAARERLQKTEPGNRILESLPRAMRAMM